MNKWILKCCFWLFVKRYAKLKFCYQLAKDFYEDNENSEDWLSPKDFVEMDLSYK